MARFGVLVLLPLVLGFAPPGPRYGTIGSNNQGNNGQSPGLNMGSSGANVRMTVNNMNTGSPQPNHPNNNRPNMNRPNPGGNVEHRFTPPHISNVPYQCTMDSDRGYFCPYRYQRPSTRYYFNVYSGRCESFYYRGCGGNLNRYRSREECVRSCACFTYADHGNYPCSQPSTYRWYFSKYSGTCRSFIFSGCNGGNDNNFRSQLECQTTCGPQSYNGPYYNGPYNMPADGQRSQNSAAQSGAHNAIENNRAQSFVIPAQSAPQKPMPVSINAPMPNFQNAPVPNSPNAPVPNGVNVPMPNGVNVPMPNGVNVPMLNMPNTPQPEPINEVNMVQGSMGSGAMTNALNGGNNGVNMNSVAQIWKMASNALIADTTSNGMSMVYPTSGQMKPGLSMY